MTTIRARVGNPNAEPLDIAIEGHNAKGQPIERITFNCLPHIQGITLLEAYDTLNTQSSEGVFQFLRNCIVPEQTERFESLLHSKEVVVHFQTLLNLLNDLVEEYSQNPSRRPADLSDGQLQMMASSPVVNSGPAVPQSGGFPLQNSATSYTP